MLDRQTRKIEILNSCRPYLRLLKAYNSENFAHNNWRGNAHSAFCFILTTIMILLTPILLILSVWHLMEKELDLKTIVVMTPICVTLVHLGVIFIALVANNRTIIETIDQIQKIINQRKFSIYLISTQELNIFMLD